MLVVTNTLEEFIEKRPVRNVLVRTVQPEMSEPETSLCRNVQPP